MMRCLVPVVCLLLPVGVCAAQERPWIDLSGGKAEEVWKTKLDGWLHASLVEVDPKSPRRLTTREGSGILVNGKTGRERDLVTRQSYGDLELELEFLIPRGSNSGVKFHSLYEIQINDSYGKTKLTGDDCGGIYPRAELKPKYRYLDQGIAPRTNASKPPGQWQKLHAVFLAPRFNSDGQKITNARLVKVTLNDVVIHENVELKTPTGHNWVRKEVATAPLLLQGDHGPVAFRHVRVRPVK